MARRKGAPIPAALPRLVEDRACQRLTRIAALCVGLTVAAVLTATAGPVGIGWNAPGATVLILDLSTPSICAVIPVLAASALVLAASALTRAAARASRPHLLLLRDLGADEGTLTTGFGPLATAGRRGALVGFAVAMLIGLALLTGSRLGGWSSGGSRLDAWVWLTLAAVPLVAVGLVTLAVRHASHASISRAVGTSVDDANGAEPNPSRS